MIKSKATEPRPDPTTHPGKRAQRLRALEVNELPAVTGAGTHVSCW